jgi:hypothetical protein
MIDCESLRVTGDCGGFPPYRRKGAICMGKSRVRTVHD